MKGPDPRASPAAPEEIPRLLREGTELLDARRFWHAHEAWESAWHALRAQGDEEGARFVKGLILVAAAFENATRGKADGFRRQGAEGLHLLRSSLSAGPRLGFADAAPWTDRVLGVYLDGARQTDWAAWNARGWHIPPLGSPGP